MHRRKRRYRKKWVKIIFLLSAPFATALIINSTAKVSGIMNNADSFILVSGKNNNAAKKDIFSEYDIQYTEDTEDTVNENIISKGFGYAEENAPEDNEIPLYKVISDNPGAKPYPTAWSEDGAIVRTTYGTFSGKNIFNLDKAGQVNNKTSVLWTDLKNESKLLPKFRISVHSDEPQVLIYHTHTTESFEPFVRDYYDASFNYRTTEETKNMVMVGNAIAKQLEEADITVIHDTTIHDYPSYNGSYDRSAVTIRNILEKYPSIKVILDIHRDAVSADGIAYQPFVEIDGKEAAQIMIISGCDDGTMNMPDYLQNFRLASLFQKQIESDYKGLTRPILFDYRKYNQNLSTGALLFEIGSHGNTLEQVQYSGELVGKSIARALYSIKESV